MENDNKYEISGIIFVIIAAIGFASKGILVKLTLAEGVSIPAQMLWRYGTASIIFILFILLKYKKHNIFNHSKKSIYTIFLAGFFGCYLATYADYRGLELLEATISRFILFTFPVFVILINSAIEKKFPPKRQIIAMLFIQVGMYFLLIIETESIDDLNIEGILWGLLAAFIYAVYLILMHKSTKTFSSIVASSYIVIFAFFVTLMEFQIADRWEEELYINDNAFWLLMLTAFIATFLPITLMAEGIKRLGSSRASIISTSSPFLTIIMAYIFLEEIMTSYQMLGGVIIFISVIILERKIPAKRLWRRGV